MTKTVLIFLCAACSTCFAQDTLSKANQMIYCDIGLGYSPVGETGVVALATLDYAQKNNLYIIRYDGLSPFLSGKNIDQFGALYGRRIIRANGSLNFSLGLSRNYYFYKDIQWIFPSPNPKVEKYSYWGIPFEVCLNGFGDKDDGHSGASRDFVLRASYKVQGNFSRNSYAAITLGFGIGYR